MKKSLYLTSALVAAGVLALGSTATMAASKAKPMKIGVSGSYKVMLGYATNSSGYTVGTGTSTTQTSYNDVDVKTDSEIHFKGSVKTDSGMTVGVAVELETDQTSSANNIDGSYVTLGGDFGTIMLGSSASAAAILAVNAPNTGALGATGPDASAWVVKPAAVSVGAAAGANIGGNDSHKIRWNSKAFSGFTIGGSYIPSTTSSNGMPANGGTAGTEASQADVAVKYSGKMGANTISASAAYWAQDSGTTSYDATSMGLSVTAGAFTVGLGIKDVNSEGKAADGTPITGSASSVDEEAVNVGAQWAQGSTTLSLNYFKVEQERATATAGEDSVEKVTLGAKYAMGPGVDFLGTVQNVKWGDESTTATNNNKGMAIVGGIAVKF